MKIKITVDVPLDEKHGLAIGSEWCVVEPAEQNGGGYWVKGAAGERVRILPRECDVIEPKQSGNP